MKHLLNSPGLHPSTSLHIPSDSANFLASSIFWDKNAKTSQEFIRCSVFSRGRLEAAVWSMQVSLLLRVSFLCASLVICNRQFTSTSSLIQFNSIQISFLFLPLLAFPEKLSTRLGIWVCALTDPPVLFFAYPANLEKVCPSADVLELQFPS